ncbi:DUF1254 domain-containing protein [Leptolyngbya sp. CCNP1308]|uniref:DUF1254 domain-containing protein n=1 Tax=Leptolyngbya sp. CCNP1308 TaxID=3110255 RepID=UPI002B2159F5|nr:DUF1254 domain-containing protein [Leptolyngbya sp. CCNP1308]MEA5448393.1 DUF1254 domain-containing protein [Leptolyngbya sp. CCNP1308]
MNNQPLSESAACAIGVEAYHYFYPLISMDVTRRVTTNYPPDTKPAMGPMNAFHHLRAFPPANFREVVRPNFDTLYSSAWLDLTQGPVIVSAPDTGDRYYMLPLMDMWSDLFAVPGKRTSGTSEAHFGVFLKGWSGTLPNGVQPIESPTAYIWIIGRTQTNGPKDYAAVHQVQDGYGITPLSAWGQTWEPAVAVDPTVDMKTPPLMQVNTMPAAQYFSYGTELLKLNPPHMTDWSIVARLGRLGIVPGQSFDFNTASPAIQAGLEQAAVDGLKLMQAKIPTLAKVVNGWQMNTDTMGVYGNYYLKRAIVAMVGLGANQPEDAIYPLCLADADGNPLDGANRYRLHFAKEELPPVDAFWSVTMYDAEGFQVANSLNRFAIGDRDDLHYNPDGSLDLYIQAESPGADQESNWLPSPSQGSLGITMRLYAPKAEVLDGRWAPPAIQRV